MDLLFSLVTPGMTADGAAAIERLRAKLEQTVVEIRGRSNADPTIPVVDGRAKPGRSAG
jgi:hypothetical protein